MMYICQCVPGTCKCKYKVKRNPDLGKKCHFLHSHPNTLNVSSLSGQILLEFERKSFDKHNNFSKGYFNPEKDTL